MSNHKNDKEFEDYLSGDSKLSKLYRSGDNIALNPGKQLDQSILYAAKQHLKKKSPTFYTTVYHFISNKFFLPLATTATSIIIIAVFLYIPPQQIDYIESEQIAMNDSSQTDTLAQLSKDSAQIKKPETQLAQSQTSDISEHEQHAEIAMTQIAENYSADPISDYPTEKKQSTPTPENNKFSNSRTRKSRTVEPELALTDATPTEHKLSNTKAKAIAPLYKKKPNPEKTSEADKDNSLLADLSMDFLADKKLIKRKKSPKAKRSKNTIYDKKTWDSLSAIEWLKRIKTIYQQQGSQQTTVVIKHFNKRYPKLKTSLQELKTKWESNK